VTDGTDGEHEFVGDRRRRAHAARGSADVAHPIRTRVPGRAPAFLPLRQSRHAPNSRMPLRSSDLGSTKSSPAIDDALQPWRWTRVTRSAGHSSATRAAIPSPAKPRRRAVLGTGPSQRRRRKARESRERREAHESCNRIHVRNFVGAVNHTRARRYGGCASWQYHR